MTAKHTNRDLAKERAVEGSFEIICSGQTRIDRPKEPLKSIGIDLGTTNSTLTIATWPAGGAPAVEVLEIRQPTLEGEYTNVLLPSVVALYDGAQFVGEGAKRLRSRASELGLRQNQNLFYECKNEIGIRKTYHRAPEGYRSAAEIGSKVLAFLADAAREAEERARDRIVVTVPASFQAAQRQDTLWAAQLAGLQLGGGDLLDEPVAAFLDYAITHAQDLASKFDNPKTIVVFDFGGGTCDVAVFRLQKVPGTGQLGVAPLAVSRYHRLGGGDIDAAIVHEVLIPQLCRQNEINPRDLTYEDKKVFIEPALLGVAEMLKVGLCIEIRRLISFNKYKDSDKTKAVKTQPGVHGCHIKGRSLRLSSPTLSAQQLEDVLKPFLDADFLYARETEYRMTCSIFAPLQDALDRAGIAREGVDLCLTVGGSSLIPQVFDAIKAFFAGAEILTYANRDEVKTCVSRGAAYHALALAAFGKGLVQPICHDEIAIRTASGPVTLVPKGAALPYPGEGWQENFSLAVPENAVVGQCHLRVEVIAASDQRPLLSRLWSIPGPVNRGAPICLEYRFDENQVLHFHARLKDGAPGDGFTEQRENPLTNVVNPEPKRLQIEEMEEELRTGKIPRSDIPKRMSGLAELYAEIGQREKAVEFMKRALQANASPDVYMVNRLAKFYEEMGDADREEKCYLEATSVSPWSGSWFNLAMSYKRRGKFTEAGGAIEKACASTRQGPYLTLAATIAEKLGDPEKSRKLIEEAMSAYEGITSQSDWELGWFTVATQMAGETAKLAQARQEQRRRAKGEGPPAMEEGELPIISPALSRR